MKNLEGKEKKERGSVIKMSFEVGVIYQTPVYGNVKQSTFQVLERLKIKKDTFIEFSEVNGIKTLYSVTVYTHYTKSPQTRLILKNSGIIYNFGKAYNTFKNWSKGVL